MIIAGMISKENADVSRAYSLYTAREGAADPARPLTPPPPVFFFLPSLGSEALSQGQPQQDTELPLMCRALQGEGISISSSDTRDPAWVANRAVIPQGHGGSFQTTAVHHPA